MIKRQNITKCDKQVKPFMHVNLLTKKLINIKCMQVKTEGIFIDICQCRCVLSSSKVVEKSILNSGE